MEAFQGSIQLLRRCTQERTRHFFPSLPAVVLAGSYVAVNGFMRLRIFLRLGKRFRSRPSLCRTYWVGCLATLLLTVTSAGTDGRQRCTRVAERISISLRGCAIGSVCASHLSGQRDVRLMAVYRAPQTCRCS